MRHFIYVQGQKVYVSDEIYKEYRRITNHEQYMARKAQQRETKLTENISAPESIEDGYIEMILHQKLHQGIRQLSANEKHIIFESFYKQRSDSELARELGVPRTTLQYQKHKIYEKLRAFLEM